MKLIAMLSSAALVLSACGGGGGMAPVGEAKAGGLEEVAVGAVIAGAGYLFGKSQSESDVTVSAKRKRNIELPAGDNLDVVVYYATCKRSSKHVVASFMSMTTGQQWTEKFVNSPRGMQRLRARMGYFTNADVNVQLESHIRYKGLVASR